MTVFDRIYRDIVLDIIANGEDQAGFVRSHWADGSPARTRQIRNVHFTLKPSDGLPLLQSKRIAWKTFFKEVDWIWRQLSNDVTVLREMGCHVWDEWERFDGTIGQAYGWQLRHKMRTIGTTDDWEQGTSDGEIIQLDMNQVQFILHEIMHNPNSRRILTHLYDIDDVEHMALEPCVFLTHWQVDTQNRLHLSVVQRSADMALGLPSNVIEYSLLHQRIAQVTGKDLGELHWHIFNAHVYDRHIPLLEEQVNADINKLEQKRPQLVLPESKLYFTTPLTEAYIENYAHNGSYKYEVAI